MKSDADARDGHESRHHPPVCHKIKSSHTYMLFGDLSLVRLLFMSNICAINISSGTLKSTLQWF